MRRYVTTLLISMTITGILTGCGRTADIGKDKAAAIALEDASLTESDVTRLRVSKDKDDGEFIYDVEFTSGNAEYEYEILASNGDILSADYDESYVQNQPTQPDTHSQQAQPDTHSQQAQSDTHSQDSQVNVRITLEEASSLALERVPGSSSQDLQIKLDYDDGRYKYEGDIIYDQKEYEFEIDADTGDFLEWKEERY